MKYVIKVTEECIKNGIQGNPQSCPIAWALKDIFVEDYGVTNDYIRIFESESGSKYCAVPPEVTNFVDDFDDGKPVQPFEFVLDTDVLNNTYYCD